MESKRNIFESSSFRRRGDNPQTFSGQQRSSYQSSSYKPIILIFLFAVVLSAVCACIALVHALSLRYVNDSILDTGDKDTNELLVALSARQQLQQYEELKKRRLFCFYNTTPHLHASLHPLNLSMLEPQFCDVIILVSLGIADDGSAPKIRDPEAENKFYNQTLPTPLWVTIGGRPHDGLRFSRMVRNRPQRMTFVHNALEWIHQHTATGIVLHWTRPHHMFKTNYSILLNTLYELGSRDQVTVTTILPANLRHRKDAYFTKSVFNKFTVVFLDTHAFLDSNTFPVTTCRQPIRASFRAGYLGQQGLSGVLSDLKTQTSFINKTVLTISIAGITFRTTKSFIHSAGLTTTGFGIAGNFTKTPGVLSYVEILQLLLNRENWKRYHHRLSECSFIYRDDQTIGYEDFESLDSKEKLFKQTAGVGVWDSDMDDFHGVFSSPAFPLLRHIRAILDHTVL